MQDVDNLEVSLANGATASDAEIAYLIAEVRRLRGAVTDAVERMWENRIGVVYVEAGVRQRLIELSEAASQEGPHDG